MYRVPGGYPQATHRLPTGYPQGPRSLHFRGKRPIPRLQKSASSSARPAAALRDHPERQEKHAALPNGGGHLVVGGVERVELPVPREKRRHGAGRLPKAWDGLDKRALDARNGPQPSRTDEEVDHLRPQHVIAYLRGSRVLWEVEPPGAKHDRYQEAKVAGEEYIQQCRVRRVMDVLHHQAEDRSRLGMRALCQN